MEITHRDVIIVGAGLSGIGAAYHLQRECPERSYLILEARERLGGTWDLFRYPGIRSDSDMYTLGYSFRPWKNAKAIADGPSILEYVRSTAVEGGIDRHIRFRHAVKRASWSTKTALWTVEVEDGATGELRTFTASFLYACAGYYDYEAGYTPDLPGRDRYRGRVVHPQAWPEDLDYSGMRVVVIGSGATAMTLVPAMARRAAHVTMLQRSPTYVVSAPEVDKVADWLRSKLPDEPAYALTRWKNVLFNMAWYGACRRFPSATKDLIVGAVKKALGDSDEATAHFKPSYNPWDQRMCLVPDGDLFVALNEGRASVVTDTIETFTERGVRLSSGRELDADLVVTATGLRLKFMGGVTLTVDGTTVEPSSALVYKGMMLGDVPNLAFAIGYTNASWTLKADLTSEYVCRLLNHMRDGGFAVCTPRLADPSVRPEPLMDFTSGYVQRSIAQFPKQGSRAPWRLHQNYALDVVALRHSPLDDGTMSFV